MNKFFLLLLPALAAYMTSFAQSKKLWTEKERALLVQQLQQTRDSVIAEVKNLSNDQMLFKESAGRWNILEIIEHLEVQDEMYWRELDILSRGPQLLQYASIVKGNDAKLLQYETDTSKADAGYLKPIGRFNGKNAALSAFSDTRNRIIDFISTTPKDLRAYFTFRNYKDDGSLKDASIYSVRDLHQLMLTNVAHTKRHLVQLKKVKQHPQFPSADPLKTDKQTVYVKNLNHWLPIGSEPGYESLKQVCRYMPLIGGNYDNWGGIPHKDILFGVLELDTGGYYPGHNHPSPEIYFVLSGEAEWTVGDQTFTATAGTAIYHPTEKMHRMVNKGKETLKVIYLWWAPNGDTSAFNGYNFLEKMPNDKKKKAEHP